MRRLSTLESVVYSALAAVMLGIFLLFFAAQFKGQTTLRDRLPVYGSVPSFSLTNQFGRPFSLADLHGKIWVADIIFTRCPASCETMSRNLAALQEKLPRGLAWQFISLTADPEFDTPATLAEYAKRHGADPARWMFLTGPKPLIYRLAVQGLKLVVVDRRDQSLADNEELFLHSTRLVLVDRAGQVRGYYEGTDLEAMEKLAAGIKQLNAGS